MQEERDESDIELEDSIDEDGAEDQSALVKKLRAKLKEAEAKASEYLTGWQKERAESVNLRKRLEEEKKEFAKFAKEDIATELIPVLDSFEGAFKNKEAWEKVDKNWRIGVEYIHNQLVGILNSHGVSVVSPLGEKFDPERDEAIETVLVEDKSKDHIVVEVMNVGYKFHNKIIRAPKVKVGEYRY